MRPVLTDAADTRTDKSKTKQLFWTTEMNMLRTKSIIRKTRKYRARDSEIKEKFKINDIIDFSRKRKKF